MKYLSGLFIISVLTFSLSWRLYAQPVESASNLQERISKLESELQELKTLLKGQMQRDSEKETEIKKLKEQSEEQQERIGEVTKKYEEATKMVEAPPEFYWAKRSKEFYDKGLSPQFGDTRTKPFLRRMGRNTYLGGYMDFEYRAEEGKNNGFDQKRLIPFIYSDISDRVKFSTEIEFEHGGVNDEVEDNELSGEAKVEFATVDFLIRDEINLRAGIVLSPLGKYNLVHDSPLQDLIDRPLVDQFVIPTTLSESGAGLFGTFYPTELSKLDYEIYAVNGFEGLEDGESEFNRKKGLREGRGSLKADFNSDPAVVGRLGFSPFLGLDFGGSFHTGSYDERNANNLTIVAFDTAYQRGPFELVGEFSNAFIERDSFARSSGVPDDMWGYYIEPRYHFMPEFLKGIAPKIFTDVSTFTAVTRWEQLDLDGNKRNRTTLGLNYRYTEDTVFKLDYQINMGHGTGHTESDDGNALLLGVATYF